MGRLADAGQLHLFEVAGRYEFCAGRTLWNSRSDPAGSPPESLGSWSRKGTIDIRQYSCFYPQPDRVSAARSSEFLSPARENSDFRLARPEHHDTDERAPIHRILRHTADRCWCWWNRPP